MTRPNRYLSELAEIKRDQRIGLAVAIVALIAFILWTYSFSAQEPAPVPILPHQKSSQ